MDSVPLPRGRAFHRIAGLLDDGICVLIRVSLFPLVILLVGAPIALLVRIVGEIARRWF